MGVNIVGWCGHPEDLEAVAEIVLLARLLAGLAAVGNEMALGHEAGARRPGIARDLVHEALAGEGREDRALRLVRRIRLVWRRGELQELPVEICLALRPL